MPVNTFAYFLLLLVFISSCHSKKTPIHIENNSIGIQVVHPVSPSLDSLKKWCAVAFTDLEIQSKIADKSYDSFSFNQKAFTGWACQTFEGNAHKYRYHKILNGKIIRQVYYYVNGQIDSDYYADWSLGFSSERTWLANGNAYLENYYSAPGVMHGLQRRWYNTAILAKEAMYNHGVLVYEIQYNKQGEIEATKGAVPNQN